MTDDLMKTPEAGGGIGEELRERLCQLVIDAVWKDLSSAELIDAILSELTAAGYAVVPREPTSQMKAAFVETFYGWEAKCEKKFAGAAYEAMLKASEEEQT